MDLARISAVSALFPKPATFQPAYGTAGFRAEASLLDSTVFRCGLVTAARSLVLRRACGLMITASHNPEPDNGVKIVEPDGGMLIPSFELFATDLARASSDSAVASLLQRLLSSNSIKEPRQCTVLLGYDTRPSAPRLVAAARAGVEALGGVVVDLGQVTTPQLHFQVVEANRHASTRTTSVVSVPPLAYYFSILIDAFEELISSCPAPVSSAQPYTLHVDCANGVGAVQLQAAAEKLASGSSGLRLQLINTGGPQGTHGGLNHRCGADYVQKEQVAPDGFDAVPVNARCCSVDGDADRLVYFALQDQAAVGSAGARQVSLLDGDKIAALAACLVRRLMSALPPDVAKGIRVGVVQTAYANGASTYYLTHNQGLEVLCTKTGVKHLHPAAHQFDVGIYFEANGHGTVLFSVPLLEDLEQLAPNIPAARQLLALSRAVNQTVGDALSGILLVEIALRYLGLDVKGWQALYSDLPSRQRKLVVKDRHVLVSSDPAERRVGAPPGLQEAIDTLVKAAGPQARAFVRASGTEDAVRVYAEAATQQAADSLALRVAQAVHSLAGGVGSAPA